MVNFKEALTRINTFVFDIDGVLSYQTIPMTEKGVPYRTVNLRDGYAIQLAVKKGYHVAVISGGYSPGYIRRLEKLGVKDIYMKSNSKTEQFNHFLSKHSIERSTVLYMGDDIPDLKVMSLAGLAVCPADADSEVKKIAAYISDKRGGEGCVRDIIEQAMRLHDKWLNDDAYSW